MISVRSVGNGVAHPPSTPPQQSGHPLLADREPPPVSPRSSHAAFFFGCRAARSRDGSIHAVKPRILLWFALPERRALSTRFINMKIITRDQALKEGFTHYAAELLREKLDEMSTNLVDDGEWFV